MSRDSSITTTSLKALLAQDTDAVWVILVTLTHDAFPQPLRICSELEAVISNNQYFLGWRFDIQFPDDTPNQLPQATALIDNVDPIIGQTIQDIAGQAPILVEISFIKLDDPDEIIATWFDMKLRQISGNDQTISGTLTYEDFVNETVSPDITPSTYPGVFG